MLKTRSEADQLVEEARRLINRALIYLKTHGKPTPEMVQAKKGANSGQDLRAIAKDKLQDVCGEQSCFAFAAKLLNSEKTLQNCSAAEFQ